MGPDALDRNRKRSTYPYLFQEGPKTDGPFETLLRVRI